MRAALFAIVTVAVTIAFAALGRPAMAMPAGYCDDRGATAIAPAPVLEAPDVAVRAARPAATCPMDAEDMIAGEAAAPGHVPTVFPAASGEPALPACALHVPPPSCDWMLHAPEVARGPDGVATSVERPPRD
jgi:hypothetical protein